MEENKDYGTNSAENSVLKGARSVLRDFLAGVCIGIGVIIPGFSGGSVAAILGVYEKMIGAIASVFKEMKKSILTLLPIGLGIAVGAALLLYPIGYMLARYPLPTVSLFVGLAIGGIPSLTSKVKGKPDANNIIALSVPLTVTAMISFIPGGSEVILLNLGFWGFVLLFIVGMIGSTALVIPGISGSMLLLILGYYNPLVSLLTDNLLKFKDVLDCILILGVFGAGVALGFYLISLVMKKLLSSYPRGSYFAIIGFIIGSVPTVYVSTMRSAGMISSSFEKLHLPSSPLHYVICLFLALLGVGISYAFVALCEKKQD